MKNTALKIATTLCLLGMPISVHAFEGLTVDNAYAYATTSVQKNGAVFMSITNNSDQSLSVIAARGDVAKSVELHTHQMDGDMMMMREVEAYDLPAHQTTTLEPMGHHIMLMGLNAPLKLEETFPLALEISAQDGVTETLDISVSILKPGTTPQADKDSSHHE